MINADGELQASERLAEAGRIMSEQPATLQLRFLQTLAEIATEKNSTIVFPVPIDLIEVFTRTMREVGRGDGGTPRVRVGPAVAPPEVAPPADPGTREGTVS